MRCINKARHFLFILRSILFCQGVKTFHIIWVAYFDEMIVFQCISSSSDVFIVQILPVSDEDGEKFICPVCNTSLLNLHDLTVHIRSHNTPASGTQSNSCKICGKVLSSQSSLDRHMLVHSGVWIFYILLLTFLSKVYYCQGLYNSFIVWFCVKCMFSS